MINGCQSLAIKEEFGDPVTSSVDLVLKPSDLNEEAGKLKIGDFGKLILIGAGISSLDLYCTPLISRFFTNKLGFCLGNVLSRSVVVNLHSLITTPVCNLNSALGSLLGSGVATKIFIPAAFEELEFRWFIQDILLKRLPQKVINKVAPELNHLVDSMPAKISRVAASALFFAVCHTHTLDCKEGGGIDQLIGGIIYGILYELDKENLANCISLHCFYNLVQES